MTEVHNMWQRKNIGWSNNTIATWTTTYGSACTIAGLTLVPWALKRLSKSTFTVLASITVGLQTALWGVAEAGWPEWRGIPLYALSGFDSTLTAGLMQSLRPLQCFCLSALHLTDT